MCLSLKSGMIQQMSEVMVKFCKFVLFCCLESDFSGSCLSTFSLSSVLIHFVVYCYFIFVCTCPCYCCFLPICFHLWVKKPPKISKVLYVISLLPLPCTAFEPVSCFCLLSISSPLNCPPPGVLWHHYSP